LRNLGREKSLSDFNTEFSIRRVDAVRDDGEDIRAPALSQERMATTDAKYPVSKPAIRAAEVGFRPMAPNESGNRKTESAEMEERDDNRRKPGRFTEKASPASYDDIPRGKGRDKARRRQQFIEEEDDEGEREVARQRAELKKQRKAEKAARKAAAPTPLLLPEFISVSNLAVALKVRLEDFNQKLEELGFEEMSHDYILNAENAGLIAMEYNYEAIIDRSESEDLKAREPAPDPSVLPQRPPVVTIMGHVDHGKTTLLDWLRKSSVAATEHGGITQHIGAFSVPMPSGNIITFLDTPGHAAFLSMRQRGANVTDIVVLVVAADDSVKPQTIEAIKHAQAAKVPIIVAINKIDKEDANVDRVKQDLARHGVDVEDFGGDTQVVCVSGKTGQGMDELEEALVTLSEILDMRAETDGPAEGWILEASIKSMGKVATVLVKRGTMRPGQFIVAGKTWARIRCLRNEAGSEIEEAAPGTPVQIDGWREQPVAGDEVLQAPDEAKAKDVVDYRLEKEERDKMAEDMEAINEHRKAEQEKREREKAEAAAAAEAEANNEDLVHKAREKPIGAKEIYFIVKGDVSGSVEAVVDSISSIGNKEVRPHILRSGVGQISEFDIEHAAAAKGLIINFNTTVDPNIAQLAAHSKVSILDHNIIYRLVDDVKAELSKHLPPLITHRVLGEAEIAEVFQITVKGRQQKPIAGCKVRNGTISKNAKVRVLRKGEKIFDGMFLLRTPINYQIRN
jgi:translation initiation factor IF-2